MPKPATVADLKAFYQDVYRPLYARFNAELAQIPQELHFEVAAAFDHLMRSEPGGDTFSQADLDRVCAHLKRATFDAFKMLLDRLRKLYDRLSTSDLKAVDNGEFVPHIERRWKEARAISEAARAHESMPEKKYDPQEWETAFDEWNKLIPILDEFEALNIEPKVCRARRNQRLDWLKWLGGIILGVILTKGLDWLLA